MTRNGFLFIDGENFKFKIEGILKRRDLVAKGLTYLDLNMDLLFHKVIKGVVVKERNYYCARLHYYKETSEKSTELINFQRKLKRSLLNKGFSFVVAGNVRLQARVDRFLNRKFIFGEKGVDVRIAVDLVSCAYDNVVDTVFLCSSDSDLQPAIHKAREKGLEVVYIGFETSPNIGLSKTSNKTILLSEFEVLDCFERLNPWGKSSE